MTNHHQQQKSGPSVEAPLPVFFFQCQDCLTWGGFLQVQGDLLFSKMQLLPGKPQRQSLGYDHGSILPKSEFGLLLYKKGKEVWLIVANFLMLESFVLSAIHKGQVTRQMLFSVLQLFIST